MSLKAEKYILAESPSTPRSSEKSLHLSTSKTNSFNLSDAYFNLATSILVWLSRIERFISTLELKIFALIMFLDMPKQNSGFSDIKYCFFLSKTLPLILPYTLARNSPEGVRKLMNMLLSVQYFISFGLAPR